MRICEIRKSANMSVTKVCVVALLVFASVVTARTLNKRDISGHFNLDDDIVLRDEKEDCNCGDYQASCKLENDKKVCTCLDGYKDNSYGICVECNCGGYDRLIDCSYGPNATKICVCKPGYLKGRDDLCQKSCSAEEPCDNGGKCENSLCQCLPGTRGEKCEVVEPCTDTAQTWQKCGVSSDVKCFFNQTSRTAYCGCKDEKKGYDVQETRCKVKCANDDTCENGGKCVNEICKCLPGTKGDKCEEIQKCVTQSDVDEMCGGPLTRCRFNQTSLKPYCTCMELPEPYGYDAKARECKECNCGENSFGCSFRENDETEENDDYVKVCNCAPGYAQNEEGQCQECDCGENAICHLKNSVEFCVCEEGFTLSNGTCEAETSPSSPTEETSPKNTAVPTATAETSRSSPTEETSPKNTAVPTATGSDNTSTAGTSDGTSSGGVSTVKPTEETVPEKTGWRTSTIVLGILLAICVIGIIFGLYKLRYRDYQGV